MSVFGPTNTSDRRWRTLVDRGANSCLWGDDWTVIEKQDNFVDLTGIDNHQVTHLALATAGAYVESHKGPIIFTACQECTDDMALNG